MNGKKLLYIVCALIISILAIVIGNKLSNKAPSESEKRFFPELTENTISSVQIVDNNDSIRLKRKGDIWFVMQGKDVKSSDETLEPVISKESSDSVAGSDIGSSIKEYPADSASVRTLLEKIVNMKKDELISTNPEKQTIFEVDSSSGILVEVQDNSRKSHGQFRIGKSGPNWNSNYVRLIGSNSVYMVSGSIKHSFFTDLKRWRDKSIIKFEKSGAKGISIAKKDAAPVILEKSDTIWNMAAPEQHPAKKEKVEEIINSLFNLKATDFENDTISDTDAGFNNPEYVVVVSLNSGSKKVIVGNKTDSNKYRVKTEDKKTVFLVNESVINKFDVDLQDLKAEKIEDSDTTKSDS
ncbi:MAG: DUF4340 domain-containing protein [Fibrobacter sp.]|nr:DUF4340 domain-containing protein [Fibrobacter sp.]